MSKRKPLRFNQEQLTQDLRESTGQGVDAFFSPSPPAPETKPEPPKKKTIPVNPPPDPADKPAAKENLQADKLTNLQADKQGNLQTRKLTNLQTYIAANLDEKATAVGSFRMSLALLDKLDDVQHLLKKRFKIRLTKKQIVAMALAFAFWDLEQKGEKSGLVRANKGDGQRKLTS
jgi:hypothetical protein